MKIDNTPPMPINTPQTATQHQAQTQTGAPPVWPGDTIQAGHQSEAPLSTTQLAQLQRASASTVDALTAAEPPPREAASLLEQHARQITLQGQLLQQNPEITCEMAMLLARPVEHAELPALPYHDNLQQLVGDVQQLFTVSSHHQFPSLIQLSTSLDDAFGKIADHLEAQQAVYRDVLDHAALSPEDKASVEVSHQAFQAMAQRWSGNLKENVLNYGLQQATTHLAQAQADVDHLEKHQGENLFDFAPRLERAKNEVSQWSFIQHFFQQPATESAPQTLVAQAMNQVNHHRFIDDLKAQNGAQNGIKTFLAAATPQGMASMLQFITARAFVDPKLSLLNLGAQALGSGALIGAAHETLDNFLKPAVRDVMASMGMAQMEKVKPEEAIPDPSRFVSEQGRFRLRTETEMQAAKNEVDQARAAFTTAQNNYKDGSLSGDSITYAGQVGAQMVRETLGQTTSLNTSHQVAGMVASFSGGFLRSGVQALGQQHKSFSWQGNTIPTHVPETSQDALPTRLKATLDKALPTINPLDNKARENYASKVWSTTEGMLAYYALGLKQAELDTSHTGGKVAAVVLNGVQSLGMLVPFTANKQSGNEAKADGSSRFASAIANIRQPDRETLLHGTQQNSPGRLAENGYNQLRGLTQAAPQALTEVSEAIFHAVGALGEQVGRQFSQRLQTLRQREPAPDIEMGGIAPQSNL
ncbi:hypothetical protein PMPD1_4295 [Paramixta manurensis]|uniref:Uncharacterized protein n=1 Tax=Paramixta manurensis TaxID=2740817 RepID=A0A6M8UHV0_9GAMM|nr:hypothetical protein PMPD1_4295 [Erwiniaceae bacterium PD-1]